MKRLKRLFGQIYQRIFSSRTARPEDIPEKLSVATLEEAINEARFLYSQHSVNVKSLAEGEIPGLPKRADDDPNG